MDPVSVRDIIKKYPNIRLATQDDNDEILAFTKTVPMRAGSVSLRYERGPNYFAQTMLQGDSAFVLLVIDEGKIAGVTAISVKTVYFEGSLAKVGYFSDLRVRPKLARHIRAQWRNVYFELVNNFASIAELAECRFLYSIVLNENEKMLKTFRDESLPISHEKFEQFYDYNILGRLPLPFRIREKRRIAVLGIKARRGTAADVDALREHLKAENKHRVLGHYFSEDVHDEYHKRKSRWFGFDISSFIIAEDPSGKIVGCVYPWSAANTKRLIVEELPKGLSIVGQVLPILGKPSILSGHELKVLYLTHLEIASSFSDQDRQAIFELMLRVIYQSNVHSGYHLMSFSDFPARPLAPAIQGKGIIATKILSSAYQLVPKSGNPNPTRVSRVEGKHMGYELGIV